MTTPAAAMTPAVSRSAMAGGRALSRSFFTICSFWAGGAGSCPPRTDSGTFSKDFPGGQGGALVGRERPVLASRRAAVVKVLTGGDEHPVGGWRGEPGAGGDPVTLGLVPDRPHRRHRLQPGR